MSQFIARQPKRLMPRGVAAVLAVVVAMTASMSHAGRREGLIAAWRTRQESARTLSVAWHATRSVARHYALGQSIEVSRSEVKAAKRAPHAASDFLTLEAELQFLCDQSGRSRLAYDGRTFSTASREVAPERGVEIVADGVQKTFFAVGALDFPTYYESAAEIAADARMLPLLVMYRGLDPRWPIIVESTLADTGQTITLDRYECLVFRHSRGEVWVDPARGYLPLRLITIHDHRKTRDVMVQYRSDAQHGWVPSTWNSVKLAAKTGAVLESVAATVSRIDLNSELPADAFEPTLPAGTWVTNSRTNESYILRADGSQRPVALGEFDGTNYLELLRSDPPSSSGSAMVWAVVSGLLGIVAIIALWMGRGARRGVGGQRRAPAS